MYFEIKNPKTLRSHFIELFIILFFLVIYLIFIPRLIMPNISPYGGVMDGMYIPYILYLMLLLILTRIVKNGPDFLVSANLLFFAWVLFLYYVFSYPVIKEILRILFPAFLNPASWIPPHRSRWKKHGRHWMRTRSRNPLIAYQNLF